MRGYWGEHEGVHWYQDALFDLFDIEAIEEFVIDSLSGGDYGGDTPTQEIEKNV